jgi:hypothetical protein
MEVLIQKEVKEGVFQTKTIANCDSCPSESLGFLLLAHEKQDGYSHSDQHTLNEKNLPFLK